MNDLSNRQTRQISFAIREQGFISNVKSIRNLSAIAINRNRKLRYQNLKNYFASPLQSIVKTIVDTLEFSLTASRTASIEIKRDLLIFLLL